MSFQIEAEHHWQFLSLLGAVGRRQVLRSWRARPPSLRPQVAAPLPPKLTSPEALAWLQRSVSAQGRSQGWQALRDSVLTSGIRVLFADELPQALRAIPDPPLALYVQGSSDLLHQASVAVVGARRCSATGAAFALRLGERLAAMQWPVVSGLALGIDAAAHRGAIQRGQTIAVLGSGLHNLHPKSHAGLAKKILRTSGSIVSEYLPTHPSYPSNFPERNRLISGLAQAVVVVEAGLRSGSLITARLALEQGREVLAVPGSVVSPVSAGCHRLLKQGAGLVTQVQDVFTALGVEPPLALDGLGSDSRLSQGVSGSTKSLEAQAFAQLTGQPKSVEVLSQATGHPVPDLLTALTRLELAGFVQRLPQGYIPSPR